MFYSCNGSIYLVSDPTFYIYPNDSESLVRDTVALNCRVPSYGSKKVNISVEITDNSGERLAYEEHSLLNNFTVVQHQVNLTSSVYQAFCRVTVVGTTSIYKTLDIIVHRVLGK